MAGSGATETAVIIGSTQALAAFVFFALAATLVILRFKSRQHRVLAAVLLLQGMEVLMRVLHFVAEQVHNDSLAAYWTRMNDHFLLAIGPALLYFVVVYRRNIKPRARNIAALAVVLGGLVLQAAYMVDPCLSHCVEDGKDVIGPLVIVSGGVPFFFAGAALLVAVDAASHRNRQGPHIMALGLVLQAAFQASSFVTRAILGGFLVPTEFLPWTGIVTSMRIAALFAAVAVGYQLASAPGMSLASRVRGHLLVVVALASGVAAGVAVDRGIEWVGEFVAGFWRLVLACSLTYALLKFRVFGIEVGVKRGIARGAVVLVFLTVFFIVKTVVELYLGHTYGYLWGGVSAGLALLALHHIEHLGDKLADLLMPEARPVHRLEQREKEQMYENFAALAWQDGELDAGEKRALATMRNRLALSSRDAELLELRARIGHAGAPTAN